MAAGQQPSACLKNKKKEPKKTPEFRRFFGGDKKVRIRVYPSSLLGYGFKLLGANVNCIFVFY